MSNISLVSSIRTNLLNLQQISKSQEQTQLRLSTGLKVNSAIENPNSYYQAQSLHNRADDLSGLLDAMGQGIQTIKAANEGIEKAEEIVLQMKAIVEQISGQGLVEEKEYFVNKLGADGAVVSTAQELVDAINSGKETICVYGQIDLGDITDSGGLQLKENQKLVGVEYFGDYSNGAGFSSISATASNDKILLDIDKNNCLASDLTINYENTSLSGSLFAVSVSGSAVLQNLDISVDFNDNMNVGYRAAVQTLNGGIINVNKNINVHTSGKTTWGVRSCNNGQINFNDGSSVNIKTEGQTAHAIRAEGNAEINFLSGSYIKTHTLGDNTCGISAINTGNLNFFAGSIVDIKTEGKVGLGISIETLCTANVYKNAVINIETLGYLSSGIGLTNGNANLDGNIYIKTYGGAAGISTQYKSHLQIQSSAQILIDASSSSISQKAGNASGNNILTIYKGAKLAFQKNGIATHYNIKKEYEKISPSGAREETIDESNVATILDVESTSAWTTALDIVTSKEQEYEQEQNQKEELAANEEIKRETAQKQFNIVLSQYDMLINDSSYKGINLLQGDNLKVVFNEDRSSRLSVKGANLSSSAIGLQEANWVAAKDIQNSLNQIISATNTLRRVSNQLGNYYSIITERQNFTENLINVLEEGADKLTLADMNEEASNMLAQKTRQQLAVNALSLASQATQSVLKLF